jgi:hypothetical protein
MALHTELPIYRTGVRLLDLAVRAQVQMPRTVKRALGEKITGQDRNSFLDHQDSDGVHRIDGPSAHNPFPGKVQTQWAGQS